jgi:Preprotein translocase subunit YajC
MNLEQLIEFLSSPLVFALAMLILFYFGLIRPYRKKMKEREKMLKELRVGQLVVTNGGIIGQITRIEEGYVWLQIAPGVEVLVVKDHIVGICKYN